jgi:hypothetical protein
VFFEKMIEHSGLGHRRRQQRQRTREGLRNSIESNPIGVGDQPAQQAD